MLVMVSVAHAEENIEKSIPNHFLNIVSKFVNIFIDTELRGVVGNNLGMDITDELIEYNDSTSIYKVTAKNPASNNMIGNVLIYRPGELLAQTGCVPIGKTWTAQAYVPKQHSGHYSVVQRCYKNN